MKTFKKLFSIIYLAALFPIVASADLYRTSCYDEFSGNGKRLGDLFNYGTCLINDTIIPLIFAIAMAMFVWGVVQFMLNSDEEAKKAKGKQFMIWGIVALTVMVGVWGLVGILGNTFGLNTRVIPQVKPN